MPASMKTTPTSGSNFQPEDEEIKESKTEKIEKWFFKPLENFREHEGFIILMVCIPLYEKYLRMKGFIKEDENFSEGHEVFKQIGKDLGLSSQFAYNFWQKFRNGLCHRGMPKCDGIKYEMVRDSEKIASFDNHKSLLRINPFKFRDKIKELVMANINVFKDMQYPLASEYRSTSW